jgi:hypothetical protein
MQLVMMCRYGLKNVGKEIEMIKSYLGSYDKVEWQKTVDRDQERNEQEFKRLYPGKKPYPDASIEEVLKNAEDVPRSNPVYEFGPRPFTYRKYEKGKYGYIIYDKEIKAFYTPSMKKKLKIMWTWCPIDKKWMLLTHREGDL